MDLTSKLLLKNQCSQGVCQTHNLTFLELWRSSYCSHLLSLASAFVGDGNGHIRHVLWKAAIGTLGSASLTSQTQSRVPVVQYQWQYQWGANMF